MAIRVARGLFRLWLVSSVLWAGVVVTQAWWIIRDLPDAPWLVTPISRVSGELLHVASESAALALIPPALVLVVGAAFVWAFQGFRA